MASAKCRNEKGWSPWSEPRKFMDKVSTTRPCSWAEYTKIISRTIHLDWRVPLCNGEQIFEYEVLHQAHKFHPLAIAMRKKSMLIRESRVYLQKIQHWVGSCQERVRRGKRCRVCCRRGAFEGSCSRTRHGEGKI